MKEQFNQTLRTEHGLCDEFKHGVKTCSFTEHKEVGSSIRKAQERRENKEKLKLREILLSNSALGKKIFKIKRRKSIFPDEGGAYLRKLDYKIARSSSFFLFSHF